MKISSRKAVAAAVAAISLGFMAAGAHATILTPGTGPTSIGTLGAAPGGAVLATLTTAVATPHWSGTVRTAVYDGPEAGVNLDFYYQVTNGSGSTDALGRVTGSDFANGWTTDLYQTAAAQGIFTAGGQTATSADRDTLGVVGFNFFPGANGTGKIDPNETSWTLVIRTNATAYTTGYVGVLNGTGTFANGFQPLGEGPPLAGPVPEPGTFGMLAAGLLAMGGMVRRRIK